MYNIIYILESCGRRLGGLDSDLGPHPGPGHFSASALESKRSATSPGKKQRLTSVLSNDFDATSNTETDS
jgi:hypothetical protein